MADIRTITILPTQTIPPACSKCKARGAGAQGTATLGNLAPGTILSGFIVNRDLSGNPILRTDNGDITFSSNFFLNIGSEVAIRVENSPAGTLAHILTVNGQPPEIAAAQSAFGQEPEVIVSQNLSTAAQRQSQAAAAPSVTRQAETTLTVTGTLVAQPQQSPADAPPPLPTGTQLTLKVTGLTSAPASIPEEIPVFAAGSRRTTGQPGVLYHLCKGGGQLRPAPTTPFCLLRHHPANTTPAPCAKLPASINSGTLPAAPTSYCRNRPPPSRRQTAAKASPLRSSATNLPAKPACRRRSALSGCNRELPLPSGSTV